MEHALRPTPRQSLNCLDGVLLRSVYQMVRLGRIQYTAGAEIPKKYLVPS